MQLVVVGLNRQRLVGPYQAILVRKMLLVEIENHILGLAVHLRIHRNLAEVIVRLGNLDGYRRKAVPQVVERVHTFAQVVARLILRLHERAPKFKCIGQIFLHELVGIMEQFGRGRVDRTIYRTEHIAAVDEAIATHNSLVLSIPHKELLKAIRLRQGVELVDVDLFASAAALNGKRHLAQASNLAHNVGRQMCCSDIDILAAIVGVAKKILVRQFGLYQLARHRRDNVA